MHIWKETNDNERQKVKQSNNSETEINYNFKLEIKTFSSFSVENHQKKSFISFYISSGFDRTSIVSPIPLPATDFYS